jgi:hypothetical protein
MKEFIVEMPPNWGFKEKISPKPPNNDPSLIANNFSYRKISTNV